MHQDMYTSDVSKPPHVLAGFHLTHGAHIQHYQNSTHIWISSQLLDNQSLMSREDCRALTHSLHGSQRNISFSVLI
jgi:hypothetical protein